MVHKMILNGPLKGGCKVTAGAEDSLTTAAGLLGVDREELRDSLTSRVMQATRGGTKGTAIKYVVALVDVDPKSSFFRI